jgi:toxin ParE1/3/4
MEVVWRAIAVDDLEQIRRYITRGNSRAARRVQSAIRTAAERLARHPEIGRIGRVEGTRELVVARTPYIVVYRIVGDGVRVFAILHSARRWPTDF